MAVSAQFNASQNGVGSYSSNEINLLLCRICGKSKEDNKQDIFCDIFGTQGDKCKLQEKLKFCFTPQVLEVTKDDHLPKLLCNACVNALDNTYANAKKIQKFQQALENKFNNKLTTSAFQASSSSQIEKKPARPTHLNLTLQDLFNHNDTTEVIKPIINDTTKNGNNAELLSTPEGPHHEELKDYIATFPNENPPPALISPKNAELLIPSSTCKINSTEAKVTPQDTNIPTIHWAENEMFPTAVVTSTVSKPSSSLSITSTLKDYRPPSKALESLSKTSTGRYATTIYKCQVCTKAFATMAYLEEHMKVHAAEKSTINSPKDQEMEVECTSCNKLMPNKDALRTHFMVAHHTSGLLHECSACQKLFPNRASVKRHLLTHSTQITSTDFSCPICQHSFAHQSLLANHLKTAHTSKQDNNNRNTTFGIP